MTKLSFARHFQVISTALGSAGREVYAHPGHRGRAADPGLPFARPRGGGLQRRRRRRWCGGGRAGGTAALRPRDPRPAAAEARRSLGAARAAARATRAPRRDRLGPLGPRHEAPRVRARRLRLPLEAVLVRRAARASAGTAATWAAGRERDGRARGDAVARRRAPPGSPGRRGRRALRPGVPPPPPPGPARRARS